MRKSFAYCIAAYAVAIAAALGVVMLLPGVPPLVSVGAADLAATLVIFLFSMMFNNSSFYDPYWSVAPVLIALFWVVRSGSLALNLRQIAVITLLVLWSVRLTYNWASQWRGLDHEDWRYRNIREQTGRLYWGASLVAIHLVPTVIVFLGCLPFSFSLKWAAAPFALLDAIAIGVTLTAILIEAIADVQLRRFIRAKPESGTVMRGGLWAYSRHPNYFGETLFWVGMFLFGLSADVGAWWTAIGCVVILGLFMFISIPLMEQHMLKHRPAFAEYKSKVPMFVPWPPSKR